jgi:proteasome accessory factor B
MSGCRLGVVVSEAVERLVNLALYLASSRSARSAHECRAAGLGYPEDQDDATFNRMFERDKDALRSAGLVIDVVEADGFDAYHIDSEATFAQLIEFDTSERASLKAVSAAFIEDPGFPFGQELRSAMAKLGSVGEGGPLASAELAHAASPSQGLDARAFAEAVQARKRVSFDYTNAAGEKKHREVDPYGVFFREGSWYLVGRDHAADEVRTFSIERAQDIDVNPARPRTPDFERPEGFDVRQAEVLPFQIGSLSFTARIRFIPDMAWRADRLARGRGELETLPDGSVIWSVEAADIDRLASWIVDHGPGILAVEPAELVTRIQSGLRAVVAVHG